MKILVLDAAGAWRSRRALAALLRDAVDHGASVGFTLPLSDGEIAGYWRGVRADLAAGRKVLLAAVDARGLCGSVQLGLEMRSNGRHRAEVQKLMVFHAARGRGIGARLMTAVEAVARRRGRPLLFLDTSVGRGGAVGFYRKLGWIPCGGVPGYAADPDGSLHDNAIFYKRLSVRSARRRAGRVRAAPRASTRTRRPSPPAGSPA
ncbi:MAG TPA: GNAT family N-acetyltransferase [Opitutaceae bacterium]|nr:GNAT family N-acetyltransferase [Opitutaceae bacterium]